ncbi:glycerophosphoryl diester phosphodiesterase membrane domain-containing protein [Croceibacterium ferulae]|uniref:glycerophosphoryl diester phosphodiesterase membrane domain-containing protein n=1 Tax=Croceibacterium ferulae TaxID=1854641 RepID=UPI000EB0B73C|nr:glycerophosphoryl diester phosphodiesterase membrane domain-containing protein [Croceibacterium ferulae]
MKFDMSAAWSEAMAMVRANREVLLVVAGIFFFLPAVLQGFVMPPLQDLLTTSDPEAMQQQLGAFYGRYGWLFLLVVLAQIAGTLALLVLLRDQRRPTVGEAIRQGFVGLLPVLGAYLLLGVAMFVAIVVVVFASLAAPVAGAVLSLIAAVGLVYVMTRLSLLLPVIAIEQLRNPLAALRRSWAETRGNVGRLLVFFLLLFVAYMVVLLVIGMITSALGMLLGEAGALIVASVVSGLIAAIATMIFTAVQAAVHRQLAEPAPRAAEPTGL